MSDLPRQAYEAWRADADPTPGPFERVAADAFAAGYRCRHDALSAKLARLEAIALDIANYPPARRGANHRQAYVSWNLIEKLRAALLGKRP